MTSVFSNQSLTQQYLSFYLPPDIQALLPTQQLVEILQLSLDQIIPIPDVAPQVMGVCNWRGEVLWLVDLGYLLGFEPLFTLGFHRSSYSVIVVQQLDKTLGLVVDQVAQMLWLDSKQVQSIATTQIPPALSQALQGYYLNPEGKTLLVLESVGLMEFSDH